MARPIERLLNLQPGDTGRGLLLFTYLFLTMSAYMAARIARDAIFLDTFLPVDLAYVDLASALLIGVFIAAYLSIGRHVNLPRLLAGSLLFYAVNVVGFWYISETHEPDWLPPVMYVWVSLFGALAPAQVWTLANYVLTTREAKRVFGLIGSGAILGAVVGAKLSGLLAIRFGAESLLLFVAAMMVLCAGLVPAIWQRREAALGTDLQARHEAEDSARGRIVEALGLIAKTPYLRSIAVLILVANVTTSLAGWQFKALAKFFIPQKDALAAFFGDFYFYAGLAGFVIQLMVTGRLLRRFGIGTALLVVPVAFVFGSASVLLWGSITIWAAIALRSCINVLQYSVDKPSVELLYLPVAANRKSQVKSFIDTVVWRFGDGVAAVAVLALGKGLGWPATRVSWIVLTLLAGWTTAVVVARQQYVDTLRASIHEHRLDAERASAAVLDRSATNLLADRLRATDPKEILYALDLFETERERASHPAIRGLLSHQAPEVRRRAITILSAARDTGVIPEVEALLKDPTLDVRTEAALYLAQHSAIDPLTRIDALGDFADFSIRSGIVAFLARPGPAQNLEAAALMLTAMAEEPGPAGQRTRLEAARLLVHLPDSFARVHDALLADDDPEVARAAVRAVARHPSSRFVPALIARLQHPAITADAADTLAHFGDGIVPALCEALTSSATPTAVRREIPAILARLGGATALPALQEAMLDGDTTLRFRVITALNKVYQLHPELEQDHQMLDTLIAAEILGHYRSYQILGRLGHDAEGDDPAMRGLRESMHQEIERIFRLLSLKYPGQDLHSAYYGVQSASPVVHDNALEFLDNVLAPDLRRVLLPLVDSTVTVSERVTYAAVVVGTDVSSPEQAVAALVASDDPWLKSCGAHAIGSLRLRTLEGELNRCLDHADPLLRETARRAKERLAT